MTANCRWGFLSTATIARKNWRAIFNAPSATLVAVASRERNRAESFIQQCQPYAPFHPPPRPWGTYQALLDDQDVDAVYIPLPTGLRTDWAVRTAEAGKHVLLEKPCATDSRQLARVIDACRQHHVHFMDGVMFMHSQRLQLLRQVLDDAQWFGVLRHIDANFSFCAGEDFYCSNIRAVHDLEPLGCLGDLGWYCIRLILWALKWQLPIQVTGHLLRATTPSLDRQGVPLEFQGHLQFPNHVTADFYCSFVTAAQQWFVIAGTETIVHANDFVLPHEGNELAFWTARDDYEVQNCDFTMRHLRQTHSVREDSAGTASSQESRMFEAFSSTVVQGKRDWHWSEISMLTQQVLDAALNSAYQDGRAVTLA